ncbi:MAG TPA: FISUMP domain-containing protein [Bacteroidales bacterium]|nr:FISUMP domain-containing protein [Bacteroidales bacterium]
MKKILSAVAFLLVLSITYGQDNFTDNRDGSVYRTVKVDGVIWMAENLRYKAKQGATYYDNDLNNANAYGMLYNWKSANTACPSGWHLPAGTDFRNLSNHFQNHASWRKKSGDTLSFTIQLGGMQDHEDTFSEIDESGYFWTSTEYDNKSAEYFSYLIIDNMVVTDISRGADVDDIQGNDKKDKYSIRCVKD